MTRHELPPVPVRSQGTQLTLDHRIGGDAAGTASDSGEWTAFGWYVSLAAIETDCGCDVRGKQNASAGSKKQASQRWDVSCQMDWTAKHAQKRTHVIVLRDTLKRQPSRRASSTVCQSS
ncbi:MAG: hypothetical protein K8L99_16830 [Anaerolineae bacterium]|nr:hypothetical protein [Anaerolineae bacterium]